MRVNYHTDLRCSAEKLWQHLTNVDLQKKWMTGLEESQLVGSGANHVGAVLKMKIKEAGRLRECDGRITAYDPHRHLGVLYSAAAMPGMSMQVDYRIVPHNAVMHLDYSARLKPKGFNPLGLLMTPFAVLFGHWKIRSCMKRLRGLVESRNF